MKTESAPAKIKIAFTQLMQQNTFDKITVAAIVKATGINRGTFYLHYEDKYALVEILAADLLSAIQQIVHDNPGSQSEILTPTGTHSLLTYLYGERQLLRGLLFSGADLQFQYKLKLILLENVQVKPHGLPEIYAKEMIVAHFMSVILLWLQRDCQEPIDQIATLLQTGTMSDDWHALYHHN